MTTLDEIRHDLAPQLHTLNERIAACLKSDNKLMDTVIASQLRTHGKQIRPVVVMLCARIFGEIDSRVTDAAAALELLHNASLIHDDVVDNSLMRRNSPTINATWDNHIAVLVGDFYTGTAMQMAINTDDPRVVSTLCVLGKQLALGEIDQIDTASRHALSEDAYFKIIGNKTASLFVACARIACYVTGAPDDATEKLARFAHLLGLCFQIRDDIFDYYSSDVVGKPTGNDLREGKLTLPLVHALLRDDIEGRDSMLALVEKASLSDDDIELLTTFARENGGIDYAVDTMMRLRQEAAEILASLPPSPSAAMLLDLLDYIIKRDY